MRMVRRVFFHDGVHVGRMATLTNASARGDGRQGGVFGVGDDGARRFFARSTYRIYWWLVP